MHRSEWEVATYNRLGSWGSNLTCPLCGARTAKILAAIPNAALPDVMLARCPDGDTFQFTLNALGEIEILASCARPPPLLQR